MSKIAEWGFFGVVFVLTWLALDGAWSFALREFPRLFLRT